MTKKNKKKTLPEGVHKRIHGFRLATLILAVLVGVELVVGTVGIATIAEMLRGKPDLDVDDFFAQESTLIYDKDGNQIADVGATIRENITYDQIPEAMVDAFLSIEDSRYFTHNGFDIPRFTRALLENVSSGSFAQGGSTFTMQLVKLTYFVNDDTGESRARNIEYKVQQIALAIELEQQSDKKSIFEMYLNKMNFGGTGNIRGVQKASEQYFGKSVSELTLSECALLAGVVNSPYYYDPHNYLDYSTNRRNEVLTMMVQHGYITQEECDLAETIKVEDQLINPSAAEDGVSYQYQAYIDAAIKEAEEVTGNDPLTVSMEIYTAMDPTVQDAMEAIGAGEVDTITYPHDLMEVGVISENNQTGEIVGICGGRNYAGGGSMLLNHATESYKQPGSSVKPFFDYALAFEYLGWATSHTVCDRPVADGNWVFQNASGTYSGDMPLQNALALSLNTPAIQALQDVISEVGQTTVTNYLASLGFTQFTADDFSISFAIGGNNFYCSPEELMAAHAVIMNGGYYIKPHTITRIVYRSGLMDDYVADSEKMKTQVLSAATCFMVATLEKYNVTSNLGYFYSIVQRSYPVFAKTGTTDWGDSGVEYGIPVGAQKDKWMTVETSQYTTTCWLGFDKAVAGENTYFTDAMDYMNVTGRICSYMLDVLQRDDQNPADISQPDDVTQISHITGIFPYVSPIDGMPSEYISTGYIKKENATLGQPDSLSSLDSLSSFTSSCADDGTFSFQWAAYPDASKLEVASHTKDISLYDSAGNLLKAATGNRAFDYSWITGAVKYKARVSQNGNSIGEVTSDSETASQTFENMEGNTETEVCGYYQYETSGTASNEVCTTFVTPETDVTVPSSTAKLSEVQNWAAQYGITMGTSAQVASEEHPDGTLEIISSDGTNITGQVIKKNALPSSITVISYTE